MISKYQLQQYILLMRPYSIVDVGLVGFLGIALSSQNNNSIFLGISAFFISILLWIGFNWFNESIQKDKGRIEIPIRIPIIVFILASIWYLSIFGLNKSWVLLFVISSFVLYAHKHKYERLTRYIFLLRGIHTVLLFSLFYSGEYSSHIIFIVILLFSSQSYRSFIGDFRDIKYDKYTFMKKYSLKESKIVLFMLGVISIISAFMIDLPLGIIVLLYIFYFTFKYYNIIDNNTFIGIESYRLHQHSILFTFFIKVVLLLVYNQLLIVSNLTIGSMMLAIGIMLFRTYGKVIRPINLNKEVSNHDSFI